MNRFVCFFSWMLVFILATANVGIANAAAGTEIEVTTTADTLSGDELCSLREAIQAVNSGASVDACVFDRGTVIHLPAGEYILSIAGASEDANASGDLDLLASMTLRGDGAVQNVIDGNRLDRVLQVHPGATVVMDGVTIRNGIAPDGENREMDGGDGQDGGGIANAGSLTLQNSVVSGNRAGNGGAALIYDTLNQHPGGNGGKGGGIFNSGGLVLQHSTVDNNTSGTGGQGRGSNPARGGHGGGIFSTGELVIADSLLRGNTAETGGTSIGSSVVYGGPGGSGGGIYSSGSLSIHSSTLVDNRGGNGNPGGMKGIAGKGGQGGGLFSSGTTSLNNTTLTANQAGAGRVTVWSTSNGGDGGGIYNSGSLTANNLTISANLAGKAGVGILPGSHDGAGGGIATNSQFLLRNSILANNISAYLGADCTAGIESRGYNLVLQADGCGFSGDLTGNVIGVDPRLSPPGNYGGPTPVMPPHLKSPAVNAGSCTDSDGNPITVDQRGVARPQAGSCDIGAVEVVLQWVFMPVVGW